MPVGAQEFRKNLRKNIDVVEDREKFERIIELREAGLTQKAIAEAVGLSQQKVSKALRQVSGEITKGAGYRTAQEIVSSVGLNPLEELSRLAARYRDALYSRKRFVAKRNPGSNGDMTVSEDDGSYDLMEAKFVELCKHMLPYLYPKLTSSKVEANVQTSIADALREQLSVIEDEVE